MSEYERRVKSLRGYDANVESDRYGIVTGDVSPVQQHLAEEVDINTIVRRFGLTGGVLPGSPDGPGVYGDFTGITDFESAVDMVRRAREGFEALPVQIRDAFGNDPGEFIRHCETMNDSEWNEFEASVMPPPAPPAPVEGSGEPV